MLREICLDTETTGLDPKSGHRIIEIGCVELLDRVPTGNNYHVYINPERDVPIAAYKVHGISTDFLKDKKTFSEIAAEFVDYIRDDTLVIHNASFDVGFLNSELERLDKKTIDILTTIDTLNIARKKFPGSPSNLDALCKRYHIDLSRRTVHGALLDAELLALVYIQLTGGTQTKLDLASGNHSSTTDIRRQRKLRSTKKLEKRDFPPSDDELKAHQDFIEKHIKEPIW